MSRDHEQELAQAFDQQAPLFERAPVQSDAAALERLVAFAAFPPQATILDAGCGPGLVAEAFLSAGYTVHGVDLSAEMIQRARARCARFGERARFDRRPVEGLEAGPFDGCVSRFVVHHAPDPEAFLRAQVERLRPGGLLVVYDHTSDPAPEAARWHQAVELARDRTHTRNLSPGELVDLCARVGLVRLALAEEPFDLDFDEWFDRGSPGVAKPEVRRMAEAGRARGFTPEPRPDGGLTLRCYRDMVRGVKRAD